MEKRKPYRSVARSKLLIKNAFVQLMLENDITRIRVKDLIARADISRGTFYAHYRDVYDVLDEIENDNISRLVTFLEKQPREELLYDFYPLISNLFNLMQENMVFFEMLFRSKNAGNLLLKFQKAFVAYMLENTRMLKKIRVGGEASMFFSFVTTGAVNLLQEWFMKQYPVSMETLAKAINNFILRGISAIRTGE